MKALKLLVIALFALTTAAFANSEKDNNENSTNIKTQILSPKKNWVFVQVDKTKEQKVNIKISDKLGRVLYSQAVKKETKVLKKFDISNLPAGTYAYEVSSANYSFKKEIKQE